MPAGSPATFSVNLSNFLNAVWLPPAKHSGRTLIAPLAINREYVNVVTLPTQ